MKEHHEFADAILVPQVQYVTGGQPALGPRPGFLPERQKTMIGPVN